jgi:hypothetical protein
MWIRDPGQFMMPKVGDLGKTKLEKELIENKWPENDLWSVVHDVKIVSTDIIPE